MKDEHFISFAQEIIAENPTWEVFVQRKIPCELDAAVAWDIIGSIKKVFSTKCLKSPANKEYWYVVDATAQALLDELTSKTSSDSLLGRLLLGKKLPDAILWQMTDSLWAASNEDGIHSSRNTIYNILAGVYHPETPEENIIANAWNLVVAYSSDNAEPTVELFLRIHAELARGAEANIFTPRIRPTHEYSIPILKNPASALEFMQQSASEMRSLSHHPLILLHSVSEVILEYRPFPSCNTFMEIIIRAFLSNLAGLPVLAYAAFPYYRFAWESGESLASGAGALYGKAGIESSGSSIDMSRYIYHNLLIFKYCVELLVESATREQLERTRREQKALMDNRLNLRQKLALAELESRHEPYDIAAYQAQFDCAYATARSDLLRLTKINLVQCEYRGRKQVFRLMR